MTEQPTRAESLAQVRRIIAPKFPGAVFSTNDDANPATPMSVTAQWRRGTIVKVIRADSIADTPKEFSAKAERLLKAFEEAAVPSRYREKQIEE